MNYISHYFLDAEEGNPYFNFGLVLPDMMGAAHRGWKPSAIHTNPVLSQYSDLARGVAAHLAADRVFHNTEFFKQGCGELKIILDRNQLSFAGIRSFFVVHILLEMMLDRLIIRKRPEKAAAFYADLDKIDEGKVLDFVLADGITVADKFSLFFNRFREHKYLLSYTKNESLFFALNRILNRTGQPAYPEGKFTNFSQAADEAEDLFEPQAFAFFDKLRVLISTTI
jgi:hypothetical protein